MREATFTFLAVTFIVIGSYALGWVSGQFSSRVLRSAALIAGILSPFICAIGLFIIYAPAREIPYNLAPFGLAILILPVSMTMALWGRLPKRVD